MILWAARHPRYERDPPRVLPNHLGDVGPLVGLPAPQHRIRGCDRSERLVDDPREGSDSRTGEILLEPCSLVDRSRLGQCDQEDTGKARIAQARQELSDGLGHVARLSQHLAVVGFGRVEQQDGVPPRRAAHSRGKHGGGSNTWIFMIALLHLVRRGTPRCGGGARRACCETHSVALARSPGPRRDRASPSAGASPCRGREDTPPRRTG